MAVFVEHDTGNEPLRVLIGKLPRYADLSRATGRDWPVLFGLCGLLLAWVYQRYRSGRPELFVVHALYWQGFYPGRGRALPNALQRSYRP